jgi:spore coat polysaccharide biosynthesis protein SpsF (cytidylyltransferase family)
MTTAIIVQARTRSTRFPGKVLKPLLGKTVLKRVLEKCMEIGPIVRLTVPSYDHELANLTIGMSIPVFYGPENDLLERFVNASRGDGIETIMRITADCPLLDPELCRQTLKLYNDGECSYAAIDHPRGGFPKGYGCEVFSKFSLCLANELATSAYDREHVTPWMQKNLRCKYMENEKDESNLNFCVDYPEDIERLERHLTNQVKSCSA